jgi:hypothetical protein
MHLKVSSLFSDLKEEKHSKNFYTVWYSEFIINNQNTVADEKENIRYEAISVHCMSHSHVGICLEEQHVLKGNELVIIVVTYHVDYACKKEEFAASWSVILAWVNIIQ